MERAHSPQTLPASTLVDHLFTLARVLQGAQNDDVVYFSDKNTKHVISEFASSPLATSIFVSQLIDGTWDVSISLEDVPETPLSTLVVIKEKGAITGDKPLESQLQTINLPHAGSSFETLRSLISVGVGSFFTEITADNKTEMVTTTKKKINELALSLQNLNQMIHVPDLSATLHPVIKDAVAKGANLENYNELLSDDVLLDSTFLNSLQAIVNDWVKAIQAVTKAERHVSEGSALDEANFWISMESSLSSINSQLESTGVQITLEVLKYAKRYHATVSFMSDIGIKDAVSLTTDHNKLMKDIPLHDLVSAESFPKMQEAIIVIFNHLKKLRFTSYPINRALPFVEAISSDLENNLRPMLHDLMRLDYAEFSNKVEQLNHVFETWDRQLKEFTNLARELLRKREEKFMLVKINSKTGTMKNRVDDAVDLRHGHEEFAQTLDTLGLLKDDLEYAYDAVRDIDILQNEKTWINAKRTYDKRIQNIESTIVEELRQQLDNQSNANEMFQVFENYKSLLDRSRIRGAIQEYQTQLLNIVKNEISHLQKNFSHRTDFDLIAMSKDYPKLTYLLFWANQTDEKLSFLLDKIELVLGRDWSSYAEGQKIYTETMVFKKKLNLHNLYDEWLQSVSEKVVTGPILISTKDKAANIVVNFDDSLMSFYKEVRALSYQDFSVPHQVMVSARNVRRAYPHAVILKESIELLSSVTAQVEDLEDLQVLLDDEKSELFGLITKCLSIDWDELSKSQDLHQLDAIVSDGSALSTVLRVENLISDLSEKSIVLDKYHREIVTIFKDLQTCEFTSSGLSTRINSLQEVVDRISNGGFSNVDRLVIILNASLSTRLADRFLTFALPSNQFRHCVTIAGSVDIEPPLEESKVQLYQLAHSTCQLLLQQKPVVFKTLGGSTDSIHLDFSDEYSKIISHLDDLLDGIEGNIASAGAFLSTWFQFQTLWEVNTQSILSELTLEQWFELLDEIKSSRTFFDSPETAKSFGLLEVNYNDARAQVVVKFNIWNREVLDCFGHYIHDMNRSTQVELTKAKKVLETSELNLSSVEDTVNTITAVQRSKQYCSTLKPFVQQLTIAERILSKGRSKFADDHIYVDQIQNDLDVLENLIDALESNITDHLEVIIKTIESECLRIENAIAQAKTAWPSSKPDDDSSSPADAIRQLSSTEISLLQLFDKKTSLIQAASLLSIPVTISGDLTGIIDELRDLKSVWVSLQSLWSSLSDLKALSWSSLKPRTLRKQLEDLLGTTRSMPVRVRQHQPFQKFLTTVTDLSNSQKILVSLKEDFVKDRHLRSLFKSLGTPFSSNLTVGDVWSLNLTSNQVTVNAVIDQANSERAIEEEIQKIRDVWEEKTLEFFDMKGHSLVKNFPLLIQLSSDHIASLSSMRNSPVCKVFENEISQWETMLNEFYQIMDVWIVVQRQWIDLEGVFDADSGVRKLLPTEYARFHGISAEYQTALKKIYRNRLAIGVQENPDVLYTMQRLSESLTRVSKALSDFLEKQRELCARLYFVGNEDLIDMIANKDNVGRHLKKMFAGVNTVNYSDDGSLLTSVGAVNGEILSLSNPVSLDKYPRLDEWLNQLELQLKITLAELVEKSLNSFASHKFLSWYAQFPLQVQILTLQINWTQKAENAIAAGTLEKLLIDIINTISVLTKNCDHSERKEALIIEMVHQKDVIEMLSSCKTSRLDAFEWLRQQRFYFISSSDPLWTVEVRQNSKSFVYGFEYLGSMSRLVYTPLLGNCFAAMTAALEQGLGGSPFGPAGTGKTETVKALGQNLGKMVLVFNCDESFDFQAITRLLLGICQIGGWGCFDEFNRLEKNILSAVSSQLELIELGLKVNNSSVKLLNKETPLREGTGLFVTMNPEYAGRSLLPENLKKLFRSFSMQKPDSQIIAQVLLRARGFDEAETLSKNVVKFFDMLRMGCSTQKHYDFGLRALKSTLEHAARIKQQLPTTREFSVVLKSFNEMVLPRLVSTDIDLFERLKHDIFPNIPELDSDDALKNSLKSVALLDGLSSNEYWLRKAVQLFKIQETQQGIMLVGASGCGKTVLWRTLLKTLSSEVEFTEYVIDPKILTKSELFGFLDPITREWVDGLLTSILRRLNEDLRGEASKPCWVVFDGDVDPVWVESLNSVLDDNKILTLPNGERLKIPPSVRFLFEVTNLDHATPATVSRCGMIWMESDVVGLSEVLQHEMESFRRSPVQSVPFSTERLLSIQSSYADVIGEILSVELFEDLLTFSKNQFSNVMGFSNTTKVCFLFIYIRSLLAQFLSNSTGDVTLSRELVVRSVMMALTWAMVGGCSSTDRLSFTEKLATISVFQFEFPKGDDREILDYDLREDGSWISLLTYVEDKSLESHAIANPNTVIETIDTLRHQNIIYSVLQQKCSLILCGPPGSGKTMTLYAALKRAPDIELCNMNFSKETDPVSVLRALEQICDYKRTPEGFILRPKSPGKRVVLFADEINLPRRDEYGTQKVINFIRQLVEKGGFWRVKDIQWVEVADIQFVGACNPPSDAGRVELSPRFLSHVPVIMVDYPGTVSLTQIYSAFNSSVLKVVPQLAGYGGELTNAMLEVYTTTIAHFKSSHRAHYVYSPRELTRWVRGIYSALSPIDCLDLPGLIRLWAHEALRLFSDRLVDEEEKQWTWNLIESVANKCFPLGDIDSALAQPILYSDWLSLNYEPVKQSDISRFVRERLAVFADEVLDINLTLYADAVDHILRIDRVLRQPQGHMILVGPSSSGKTTLTKFVAWVNGLNIHQLNVRRRYTLAEFDITLKDLLKRTGVHGEKICFIVDESTILDGSFLERMNSLLANSQIQELFDQDEYSAILSGCKEQVNARGLLLDSSEELYNWFTEQVAANLHVVFTISDPESNRFSPIIASPALFNRCVLNWMGYWSDLSLIEVIRELLRAVPIDSSTYRQPSGYVGNVNVDIESFRDAIVDCVLFIHKNGIGTTSPGKVIELLQNFVTVYDLKGGEIAAHHAHVNSGLVKLKETMIQVKTLKEDLSRKEESLKLKETEAKHTLNKILTEQNEAERKQEASIEIQAVLEKQEFYIQERRQIVMEDLSLAQPAVLEARRGVQNIKKQHLTELRSMSTPPATVQLVLESVCVLLGYNVQTWRDVQSVIRKDDFIASIVSFDCESQVTAEVRQYMDQTYLSRSDYSFAAAERASKACGPLLQWVEAQIKYAVILDKIGPLRDEVDALEEESHRTQTRLMAADEMIKELEDSIEQYKDDYSELIRETERIKSEISSVELNVKRSVELVDNLSSERTRWAASIKEFDTKHLNLCGTALLSAAALTHIGPVDQRVRTNFIKKCSEYLTTAAVPFEQNFRLASFLNTPGNLLLWEEKGLSNDEVFFENVTIIEKTYKTPFIIDPYGTLLETISAKFNSKKITLTSFLDDGFARTLENTLRFGGCLIIQDAEYFDPLISPLLNGDVQKVGGRTLVRLGGRDIDCSKSFELILHTTDTFVVPASFVTTRTSIVDFTITDSSLITQAMNMTLATETPEVERQRIEMVKLDSEYKVKLRDLESSLLTSLSESKEDLLTNVTLLETLEKLKTESIEVQKKMVETTEVMNKIENVTLQYDSFVRNVVLVYGIIRGLASLSDFYQTSLSSYISCIDKVLKIPSSRDILKIPRVNQLMDELYKESYSFFSISLRNKDKAVFALALSLMYISEKDGVLFSNVVLSLLKKANDLQPGVIIDAFKILSLDIDESTALKLIETADPTSLDESLDSLKPFISALFSADGGFDSASVVLFDFLRSSTIPFASKYTLDDVILSNKGVPIILGSSSGFDASSKVRSAASSANKTLKVIAMGSQESLDIAMRELTSCSKTDSWLLIQNVQTAGVWLEYLEKRMENLVLNPQFRLLLTCDCDSHIPATLLRYSDLLIFESPPGVKTVMSEYLKLLETRKGPNKPAEKGYVLFLVAWYHTIVQEVSRFAPVSFSKRYDFNDSDFAGALFLIDRWFDTVNADRTNVAPEKIEWAAIQFLVSEIVYGGKVTNADDAEYLKLLAKKLFKVEAFEVTFNLVANEISERDGVVLNPPEGKSIADYKRWIDALPDLQPSSWLGLEKEVEAEMKRKENSEIAESAGLLFEDILA